MTSLRPSLFLLAHSFVLASVSCGDHGTADGTRSEGSSGESSASEAGAVTDPAAGGRAGGVGGDLGGASSANAGVSGHPVTDATAGAEAGGEKTTGGALTDDGHAGAQVSAPAAGSQAAGGDVANGGNAGVDAATSAAGTEAAGGATANGGSAGVGAGASAAGGEAGGAEMTLGGATTAGGTSNSGGSALGGAHPSGGGSASGGASPEGGTSSSGGSAPTGGTTSATGGSSSAECKFVVTPSTSPHMPTVGIVEWATTLANPSSAKIVYALDDAPPYTLNPGGSATVDLAHANYRTLLLGLKPSSSYTLHIEASSSEGSCRSPDYTLETGALSDAPSVTRTVSKASALSKGFIVTSSGMTGTGPGSSRAYVIDADGTVVWSVASPVLCSRARMDWEGANMWMLALNVNNGLGELRTVSMDGETGPTSVSGLSSAHHDFAVLPGGVVAAMAWASSGTDPESNLIERLPSGTLAPRFKIGSNLYLGGPSGGGYHANYVSYHWTDDSYTIADRNPNVIVKVTRSGNPIWQIGGSCGGAPAPKCAPGGWQVVHGHDFASNGNLLFFNNAAGDSHVFELLVASSGTFGTAVVEDFVSGSESSVLGDVQRLPNGNTLITYSTSGMILEVDPSWAVVQVLRGAFGYADWRETLYGPPARL
jgi:hypothetical protein